MKKNFTFLLPDEPYKNTTALNKVQSATYTGPRYLAICVTPADGKIKYVARRGETLAEIDMETLVDDDPATEFFLIDANEHAMECAYLTHAYETGEVPDYSEEVTDADGNKSTYEYHYDDNTGAMGQCFYHDSLTYVNGNFVGPQYRLHANTKESVFQNYQTTATAIEASLAANDYTDEDATTLRAHVTWLRDLPRLYANVDHWKIPFPNGLPEWF